MSKYWDRREQEAAADPKAGDVWIEYGDYRYVVYGVNADGGVRMGIGSSPKSLHEILVKPENYKSVIEFCRLRERAGVVNEEG